MRHLPKHPNVTARQLAPILACLAALARLVEALSHLFQ